MKKTTVALMFLAGLLAGLWIARSGSEVLAQAPGLWECRSWTLLADADAGNQVGPFLRNAVSVQMTSASLSNSRYALMACKR